MSYLVPCPKCGTTLPIELGMSGETLRCSCGNSVEVPTLRVLRDMPRDDVENDESGWTWRHGVLVLGAMIAVFGISMGVYLVRNQYQMQPDKAWDQWSKNSSPTDNWKMWYHLQKDGISGGMNPRVHPSLLQSQYAHFSKMANDQKLLDKQKEWVFLAWAVGAFGLLFMASTLFFPARTKVGLPGLKSVEMTPTPGRRK